MAYNRTIPITIMNEPSYISIVEFDQLEAGTKHSNRMRFERQVLMDLEPDSAVVFDSHGNYRHGGTSGCGIRKMATIVGNYRGLIATVKHIEGKVAVSLERM